MKTKVKKATLAAVLLFAAIAAGACPVCERQKPEVLQGITHGTGPQDRLDYIIISIAIIIVLLSLWFSVRYLIKPGERSEGHIKRFILEGR
ncbi:MAG: hypothetical protein ABWY16_21180 [Pedobacter sp.]|uniref:hypothetical protein n=1 Tax=Pedobacter sp. TaxID=1411316 RepID=UPI0033946269